MSSKITIAGEQSRLIRNQETPVRVVVYFDKSTKVRGIRCRFHGAEQTQATYTTTTTDSKGKVTTQTHTATEYVDIVKQEFLLHGNKRMGFFARLIDSLATWFGGGKHNLVEAGEHEFFVTLKIPESAPASFKGKKCQVFYKLNVSVDLPIKIDWSQSQEFEVSRNDLFDSKIKAVHVVFPDDEEGRTFWDKTFGKDVKLNLALERDTMSVGERALAMLTVESPEPLKIDNMEVCLVGRESCVAQGHKDGHTYKYPLGNIDSPKVISSESVHEFDIQIPKIDGPFSNTGTKFDINWTIEVRLKVPWAKDPTIRVPIKIVPSQNDTSEDTI